MEPVRRYLSHVPSARTSMWAGTIEPKPTRLASANGWRFEESENMR